MAFVWQLIFIALKVMENTRLFFKNPYNFNSWGDGKQRTGTARRALQAVKRGYAYVVQNEKR